MPANFKLVVTRQLGREPNIQFSVAESCIYGWPAVVRNAAMTRSGKPNPNLFYLTCPYLVKKVSNLEDKSLIRKIQEKVKSDTRLSANLKEANRKHGSAWLALAGKTRGQFSIQTPNIAGAGDPLAVKCLHAHLAYHLVDKSNKLGAMVAAEIPELWCSDEMCLDYLKNDGQA